MTGRKNTKIVFSEIVEEEIEFRGEKILREKVEKKWKIPKTITTDIGFQLMFGFDPPSSYNNSKGKTELLVSKLPGGFFE